MSSLAAPGGAATWPNKNALILIRQERFRHAHEQQPHRHHDDPVHHEIAPRPPRDMSDPALVAAIHSVEAAIEPAEKPSLALGRLPTLGFKRVAHKEGVKISATSTDKAMAETMVMENWR